MAHKLSTVIIRPREGSVPSNTAHLSWECFIDGEQTFHASKADAEKFAQTETGRKQRENGNGNQCWEGPQHRGRLG